MENKVETRERWGKKREYILAVAGNVVGLGNVCRFPYLCYKNGGGIFLLPYLIFAMLLGVPIFLLETVIGQYTQEGALTCWDKLCPMAKGIGYACMVNQLYYTIYIMILGWALFYLVNCFRQPLPWATCQNPWNTDRCVALSSANLTAIERGEFFFNLTSGNLSESSVTEFWKRGVLSMSGGIDEIGTVRWELLLCLLASWVTCYFCTWKGVRSTGKVVYITAVFPYIMLAVLLVRGITLPGAWKGVMYFLYPDPSRLADIQVWMEACSQVLFSYGVAGGTFMTLSSYNKVNNNCYRDSLGLCALNSGTSLLAGFTVFSTLGFMAQAQGVPINMVVESGPGLAFIAFPQAVALMPMPQLWATCFFIMLLFLGLDTSFTCLETIISAVIDTFPGTMRRPWRRELFLLVFCFVCFIVQIVLTTQGGVYIFELVDYYGFTGTCILFVCMAECVAVGWAFGAEKMCDVIEDMTGQRPWVFFKFCWLYFSPLTCVICIIFFFLEFESLTMENYVYPNWAHHLGWTLTFSSVILIPTYAIANIWPGKGNWRQRLLLQWRPVNDLDGAETNEENLETAPMSPTPYDIMIIPERSLAEKHAG